MSSNIEIDHILSPIARQMSDRANEILDLREAATQRKNPGQCLQCYFKLLSRARNHQVTTPLRDWLEQHLEVVARAPESIELERLPLQLNTENIQDYCYRVINAFREDRPYQHHAEIELSFQFKAERQSVA